MPPIPSSLAISDRGRGIARTVSEARRTRTSGSCLPSILFSAAMLRDAFGHLRPIRWGMINLGGYLTVLQLRV
jgi:hypothetical protein